MYPFVAGVLVALVLTAPTLGAQRLDTARVAARVTALADAYVREYVRTFPISAELSGLSAVPHDRLDANSLPTLRAWQNKEDRWAASLAGLDGAALWGRPEWVTYGFLREALESSRQLRVCRQELWPVNQMSGWLSYLPSIAESQPVGTTRARRDALARWSLVPAYLAVEMRNAQEGLRRGYSTPRAAVDLVVQQVDGLLALPDTAWPFYDPARRDTTPVFRGAWRELIARRLRPAAAQYREFLVSQYAPHARDTLAVSAQPNGAACYRAAFRAVTSLNRPPEETYRLGQELVARDQDEIRTLGRDNFGTDSLPVLLAGIDTLPGAHFKNRDEMLAVVRDAVHARAKHCRNGLDGSRLPTS